MKREKNEEVLSDFRNIRLSQMGRGPQTHTPIYVYSTAGRQTSLVSPGLLHVKMGVFSLSILGSTQAQGSSTLPKRLVCFAG